MPVRGELVGPRRCRRRSAAGPRPGTSRTPAARCRSSSRVCTTGRGRPSSGGQTTLAVEANVVRRHRAGLEVVDEQQRVVVALDRERPRAVAEHLDLARRRSSRPRRSRSPSPRSAAAGPRTSETLLPEAAGPLTRPRERTPRRCPLERDLERLHRDPGPCRRRMAFGPAGRRARGVACSRLMPQESPSVHN